jgi:hypothetical protein
MKRGIVSTLVVALVSMGLAAGLHAQAKKDEATGLDRLEGYVVGIDKTKSEIKIRQRGTTSQEWTIAYTPATKFTYVNEPATMEKVKEGVRLICLGSFGTEKTKLTAERIDVRTDK